MSDVSGIGSNVDQDEPQTAERLLALVYDELKKIAAQRLAREKPGLTLQTTALVHEAYIRLVDVDDPQRWNSRGHFFAAAAESMRRILIERARGNGRIKRGGDWRRVDLDNLDLVSSASADQVLTLDEAIEGLAAEDPVAAGLVKLRYYAGLSIEQAAESMDISTATAYRHWAYARAWLLCALLDERE